jgi:hypothetical protein
MPLPWKKNKAPDASSEINIQSRALIYSQPDSDFQSSTKEPEYTSDIPGVRPATRKLVTSDIFADIEYRKREKAARDAKRKAEAEAAGIPEAEPEELFERPSTPPQGSRAIPWESYHDLPSDHPVFLMPDDVREKLYAKNIGMLPRAVQRSSLLQHTLTPSLDPVMKALADQNLRGKVYGKRRGPKGFLRQGRVLMNTFGDIHRGGTY